LDLLSLPLFFHSEIQTQTLVLSEEESRHCTVSLRVAEGETILITDGQGTVAQAKITKAHPKATQIHIVQKEIVPKAAVFRRLVVAPPKTADRLEWMLEKAFEVGVEEVVLIETRYSERDKINLERLEKLAIATIKQSKQVYLPRLVGMIKWKQFIGQTISGSKYIAALADKSITHTPSLALSQRLKHDSKSTETTVLIGPEGDFSPEEVTQSIMQGYQPISLGANVLRTETAAVYALSILNSELAAL
jgi:16S rRNA (uracil1498-N3)-methyltransferase